MSESIAWSKPLTRLAALGVVLLTILTRLTALNQYLIVDEPDRWRWAEDFVLALTHGDLAATRVGDGYPGIVPVWAESLWILLEAARRSLVEGHWIGDTGLNFLLHEWERTAYLYQQRLPIVLLNIGLALLIIRVVWRLFGPRVGLVAGLLVALDPFYLSDSRVNRAEAVITGLMTLSVLSLLFFQRTRRWRYVILSGVLGGLSFLTKIQALALLPTIAVVGVYLELSRRQVSTGWRGTAAHLAAPGFWWPVIQFGLVWSGAALATWVVLWPSMWVIPLDTLTLVYRYTTRKVGAEGINLFFMGRTYQNADPGLLFYPVVLLMRLSPVTLLGLALWGVRRFRQKALAEHPGLFILTAYALLYTLVMTAGSHKQDRYLMPIFLSLDILAAVQLANFQFNIQHLYPQGYSTFKIQHLFLPVLAAIQLAVVLPHHPYYYPYFNPLFGGGRAAVHLLRIGWGEGMDLVGDYLAAKPNSRDLVVASRFTHNMVRFRGKPISLQADGRWTQADYIVLYIHQVQRRIDPDPQFIDYFLTRRTPEKVIRLNGIDYAWIYPIPFTTPADPQVSRIEGQASLLGYRWQTDPPGLRVFWRSLDRLGNRQIAVRLAGDKASTGWTTCSLDPAFAPNTATAGAYLESICTPRLDDLPPGLYSVEVRLASGNDTVTAFPFPQGRYAARRTPSGQMEDTPEIERLDALVDQAAGGPVNRLDRVYGERLRLAAYRLDPPEPRPGDQLAVTLYWQGVDEILTPLRLTVQMADSRLLSLGREDRALNADRWLPGLVVSTTHSFNLPQTLDAPLAAQIEVELVNEAEVPLPATTHNGEPLDTVAARLTVSPPVWPDPPESQPVAVWQGADGQPVIGLYGVRWALEAETGASTLTIRLYWAALAQVGQNYQVFVHLLDESGQIVSQHDGLPREGGYPTPWWQTGKMVEDVHSLLLPHGMVNAPYRLAVGLYRPDDGQRLRLVDGRDSFALNLEPQPAKQSEEE